MQYSHPVTDTHSLIIWSPFPPKFPNTSSGPTLKSYCISLLQLFRLRFGVSQGFIFSSFLITSHFQIHPRRVNYLYKSNSFCPRANSFRNKNSSLKKGKKNQANKQKGKSMLLGNGDQVSFCCKHQINILISKT